jgi:hypothetical protein
MGAFVVVAVVILSSMFAGSAAPLKRMEVDRMPPPLPENVAAYEAIDPHSTPASEYPLLASVR